MWQIMYTDRMATKSMNAAKLLITTGGEDSNDPPPPPPPPPQALSPKRGHHHTFYYFSILLVDYYTCFTTYVCIFVRKCTYSDIRVTKGHLLQTFDPPPPPPTIAAALHDLSLCMLSTTHIHHTKSVKRQFNLFTSDAAYQYQFGGVAVWDQHMYKQGPG